MRPGFFFAALLMLTQTWTQAQQRLVLNGTPVPGLSTELVPGTAYAPAEGYARALGADYRFDAQAGVVLLFGGRLLSLRSSDLSARAAAPDALMVDGRALPGPGAVRANGTVYLPVKSVTAALGGHTAYLAEQGTVAAVFPRPQLLAADPPNVWGSFERFVLTFSAPVALEDYFEPSLDVVRFRFPRAELGSEALAERRFSGSRFSDAAFVPNSGFFDFNLTLQPGNAYSFFSEPLGEGERVVIDVFRSEALERRQGAPTLVLGAGAGTADFARRVQGALGARGVRVAVLTGAAGAAQAQQFRAQRFTAPMFLSLRQAPLAAGRFSVYYLGAGAPTLDAPVRFASAEATLSEAARARLAGLTPDLARGERLARGLADALERRTPLTLTALMAAPLLELSAAAGRGVLLELSPADLHGATLSAPLADALADLLEGR